MTTPINPDLIKACAEMAFPNMFDFGWTLNDLWIFKIKTLDEARKVYRLLQQRTSG
jgi:hypothetical protein